MLTATPRYHIETLPNGLSFEMVKVEGGTFLMGSERYKKEQPLHEVKVSDFFIGKYPVTQELWQAVMGSNPARFPGRVNPVDRLSWVDTQIFLKNLNSLTRVRFNLPTEAEWEYAARGGTQDQGLLFAGSNRLKEVGWYRFNSHDETKPVGLKLPNELGIYDMSGNVWEWCADYWHENYNEAPTDGRAWIEGGDKSRRVVRGGSWGLEDDICYVSYRESVNTNLRNLYTGFRLARY